MGIKMFFFCCSRRSSYFGIKVLLPFLLLLLTPLTANGQMRVMALGDSLCHNNMRPLRSKVATSGLRVDWVGTKNDGPAPDPDNECHGGWEAAQVLGVKAPPPWEKPDTPVLPSWVTEANPQIVLVMLGTNDIIRVGKENLESNLGKIVDVIAERAPGVHIVVASIPPITYEPAATMVREINLKIPGIVKAKRVEGKKISFLDMYNKIPQSKVRDDKVHLTDAGNQAMANAWFSILESLLKGRRLPPTGKAPAPQTQTSALGHVPDAP